MKRLVPTVVLGIVIVLQACHSSPPTRFFTLTSTDGQKVASSGIGGAVHVAAVHISESLDQQEIIRESEAGRVVFSNRNRWAAPLDEMLREVLTRDLVRRLPPGSVVLPDEPSPPGTRRIVLDVIRFADNTTGKVVLTGGWSLVAAGSDVPLLRQQVQLSDTTGSSGYPTQVAAMSRLLGQLADQIAREVSAQGGAHAS